MDPIARPSARIQYRLLRLSRGGLQPGSGALAWSLEIWAVEVLINSRTQFFDRQFSVYIALEDRSGGVGYLQTFEATEYECEFAFYHPQFGLFGFDFQGPTL